MLKYLCGFYIENLMYIRFHRKQRVVPQFYGFIFGYGITYKEYKYENSVTDEKKFIKKMTGATIIKMKFLGMRKRKATSVKIKIKGETVMAECTHECDSCEQNCSSRGEASSEDMTAKLNKYSSVKKVIGVVSGKGGVGKSMVTSLLAVMFNRKGYHTAILDADITGPSIPKGFGISENAVGSEKGILPVKSKSGIDIMSVNLLLQNETDPVVWRGPILAGTVKQFWTDVVWENVDYMFVDMPPGTGDVPLTVFQSLPLDGIVIVTSPQELVSMIVTKAVKMASMMNIPIFGIVENMSYFECPDCKKRFYPFGESKLEETAKEYSLDILARLPIDPKSAKACDEGKIESIINDEAYSAAELIEKKVKI